MKKKSPRKLNLSRETLSALETRAPGVRELDAPAKLKEVAGGRPLPTGRPSCDDIC